MSQDVSVPLDQLTNRQLHLHLISLLDRQAGTLDRLDAFMSDLTTSVAALQGAVDNIAVRFASSLVPLTQALSAAQAALAELTVEDDATKAALSDALAAASAAAASIDSDVAELNAIGAAPEAPVEPVPVEELPPPPSEEPPAEEDPGPAEPVEDPGTPSEG